ncbi:hypothetical protein LB515_09660 [Mesorhizobium sp. CA15]|uniref:hypothetical protein n=1 Tax=Mesorhizobium sp. CA15 TaxID=2876641 RepID=UPI001CD10F86|nr:hypothetical protein [Mesorhizobium sp. CA15]MBZ9865640.1 hypothetical protein [Mesorhizobium sp. CA15]
MVAFLPKFSFVNNIFTYGIPLQATIGEIFARPAPAEEPPATPGKIDAKRLSCLCWQPRSRGALLPGRSVYGFDEATLAVQKLAESDEVGTPMCVRIIEDRLQS